MEEHHINGEWTIGANIVNVKKNALNHNLEKSIVMIRDMIWVDTRYMHGCL